jgi:hypothetical protein
MGCARAELEKLRTENESLPERLTELERPRGLGRLWAWLFRRNKKETVELKKEDKTEE